MDDNGILSQVSGEYVAHAAQTLPNPATAQDLSPSAAIDAGPAGTVRIFYERKQARHHKHGHHFWTATRAEAEPMSPSPNT